jgi:phosphoserine phosphatase RsbU/P
MIHRKSGSRLARRLPTLWTDLEALARLALLDREAERALLESRTGPALRSTGAFSLSGKREEFEIHTAESPARVVSGDYHDAFLISDRTLALVMADVSGKGTPAALLKGVTRSVLRNVSSCSTSPGEALTRLNRILVQAELGSMFVSLFLGWYDISSGSIRFANAGHPLPYRVEPSGRVRAFGDVTGPILGILEQEAYEEKEEELEPGDRLVLYTDGVTEARSPEGGFFGHSRLMRLLSAQSRQSAESLCRLVQARLDEFQSHRPQDDATLLVFHRKS